MSKQFNYEAATTVSQLLAENAPIHLIDVRSRAEFIDGHASGARSLPLDEISRDQLNQHIGMDDAESL